MNPHDETQDEERIASLLAATERDAVPPDPERLARLRAQSTAVFAASSSSHRRRPMLVRTATWLTAAAAAIALIWAAGVYFWPVPLRAPTLAEVFEISDRADTVHLRFTSGQEIDFWHTRQPERSRWDDLAGNYRIADGAQYWIVNESVGEARRVNRPTADMHSFRSFAQQLGVRGPIRGQPDPLDVHPVELRHDGKREVLVYRMETEQGLLEALVEAATRRLYWMRSPRGELTVVAYDEQIGAEKFAVSDTLTEDGRLGKVADVQGIVTVRPALARRWTPVWQGLVVRPGDYVRTDARGANAVALRLVKQTGIILGPKSLIELVGPTRIRLIEGELEIAPGKGAELELVGPGGEKTTVKARQVYQMRTGQMLRVEKDPAWLLGFKGATGNNVLGSLVALVDGRNVPLTVGYHKVTVDIRDQIARTVIEESFVNHTDAVLEGVFNFPLPPDASISGFGMWIGNQLVEADVVEKQRAREIYETFLRERRDPALLEWSGGNLFKARVFPIQAHSEKRIKITYTQVLPLKEGRYRYSYALVSEMLQQHPLRDLNIDVKLHSAVTLKSVTSPTHPTRDEKTKHAAHLEFTAQEYTPTRDFEVVVEVANQQADAVLIPHRRGDDGYLMLQITPPVPPLPDGRGSATRGLLPDGEPVQLLILADTSASIDTAQRATQATFIGTLLSALAPKDTFNLAACDATCDFVFPEWKPGDSGHIATARDFLAKRTALGWTNLDGAFAAALKRAGPKTHIIYVGDGIVTTGGADPVAFTKRLQRLYGGSGTTLHAVSLGSSYEAGVMKTIASLGGGSLRKITGEQGPQVIAQELLGEIAQPVLRDIKVEFRGIKVARLYPEQVANVPAGSQLILMGRYLPEGKDQDGEVIVSGTQGGKPVRFSARVSLKDAEHGNGFIPRLWARMHLDTLLEQGASDVVRDEIITLSEEFSIITPYTSLLVLETDADRERFKVVRRFRMRDGERFFAEGRDNAMFDLAQKQMKRAGAWRTALRRSVLSQLARLGREPRLFHPEQMSPYAYRRLGGVAGALPTSATAMPNGGGYGGFGYGGVDGAVPAEMLAANGPAGELRLGELGVPLGDAEFLGREGRDLGEKVLTVDDSKRPAAEEPAWFAEAAPMAGPGGGPGMPGMPAMTTPAPLGFGGPGGGLPLGLGGEPMFTDDAEVAGKFALDRGRMLRGVDGLNELRGEQDYFLALDFSPGRPMRFAGGRGGYGYQYASRQGPDYRNWLDTLFPPLLVTSIPAGAPKSTWPAAARDLAKSLLRKDQLTKLTGGIAISRTSESFDPRWGDLTGRARRTELFGAKTWLTRSDSDGGQTLISWCDSKQMSVYSRAFQLGRTRAATALDVQTPPLALQDHSLTSLERTFADHTAAVEPVGKHRARLVLTHPDRTDYDTHILIDTARHVILAIESRHDGKLAGKTAFGDFVQVGGTWWAQRIETTDTDSKRTAMVAQTVKTLEPHELDQRIAAELTDRPRVQFVHLPLPGPIAAKKALAAGKMSFEDAFTLMLYYHASQQWPRVLEHLQQAEQRAAGKPGMRWLHSAILHDSRRHEELRKRYQEEAARLAKETSSDAYALADYLAHQSAGVLQANEMLALLDVLRPLYDKQPAHVGAARHWQQWRVTYLTQAGRTDEALALRRQLALAYPHDSGMQHAYAHTLASTGDYPAAYAWLTRVLGKDAKWSEGESESLRSLYAQLLDQQGRSADLLQYVAAWTEENPASTSAYHQYLSALIRADQPDKAETLALRWLKDAQVPGKLTPPAEARLNAAVAVLMGNAYQLYTNRIEERFLVPLAQAALYFGQTPSHAVIAKQIVGNYQFQRSDEGRTVIKAFADILAAQVDKLPVVQVQQYLAWVGADDLDAAAWQKIVATLRQRWNAERDEQLKHTWGEAIIGVLGHHGGADETLAFLRLVRTKGPERYRTKYTQQLFNHLLVQPWTAEIEAEALSLLDQLSDAQDENDRRFATVAALHGLTDKLLTSRYQARMKAVEHQEKLTRTELMKKQQENWRLAREGLADQLRDEAAKHPKALARWLVAESDYLDVPLDRHLQQAAAEAWEVVGAAPPAKDDRALDEMLRQRYLVTLMNLAARKGAEPGLAERLLKYIDAGIGMEEQSARWKLAKYRMLVALDRPKELERVLGAWTKEDDVDSRWRVALGYVLAEQGRLAEAIRQFEAVEKADELTPPAYRALSDWYLVENRRDDHERAARGVYGTMQEWQLQQMLQMRLQPWQGGGHLPSELDAEVIRMFAVLFDKSASPQNYLYMLQQFYDATHDFRLLAVLADSVIGQSAAHVYPFVENMGSVLTEVRDEATSDELVKRIAQVRSRAKTVVDQRALDLLEVQVERRAAELQNQAGPHRDRALATLVRAGKREWSPGEPRLMANFLAGLGRITQEPLAKEQLRQLEELHAAAKRGSQDRLHIGLRRAMALNGYGRRPDAIDLLQSAVDEFQQASAGILPVSANEALTTLVGLFEDGGHFARGEKLLEDQLRHPVHAEQRRWLIERLDTLYHNALARDGEVSLGKGPVLYQALELKIRRDMLDIDPNHRYRLIGLLCGVYRTAHQKKQADDVTDLTRFAFEVLPGMLPLLRNQHSAVVSTVAQAVHDVAGPEQGVAFLVVRIEAEPRSLRYGNQDGWNQHGWTLSQWRIECKNLGEVEDRLLRLVLAELRRDLESREGRSRPIYSQQWNDRFWKEKADDFLRVAEEVLAVRSQSGPAVVYIANYLYHGLGKTDRAIEAMFIAHKQQLLDESGQVNLVDFLHRQDRHADSITVLEPLVKRRPENIEYRVQLMHSYFRTNQQAKLLALLKDSDAFFHAKDRWTEPAMARLAASTLQNALYAQSIAYYKEAIPLHERTQPGRGVGNGVLSSYYMGLANAHAGLNKTTEAVDAAGAAIVAWGSRHDQRASALETLRLVLARSPNLDAFVAEFDKRSQDSAIVRKALGQAYRAKGEHGKAVQQLEKAAELQPNDGETRQLLVGALDQTGDKEGALRQLLAAAQTARRDLKLYEDLGKRYAALGQPEEAERAYTSIVEVQPAEAESHTLLAEVREKQDRWAEAIEQWEQVARLRALEPTGLLKLAAAQIHERRWDAARESLHRLESRNWPQRFGDVRQQARALEAKVK
jgi:Flp pilus assembly protein TadD